MKSAKITSLWVFIILSNLTFLQSCKDIAFNNPLDPDASKEVLKIIRVFQTTATGRGDIAFDGEKFWKINTLGTLTAIDKESGSQVRSFSTTPGTGVCFFDNSIYTCGENGDNMLTLLDPLSGNLLNRIPTSNLYPGFLAAANGELILYDGRSSGIFQYDPQTGSSFRLFEVPGINIGGIDLYNNNLLMVDKNTDTLYLFSMTGEITGVFASPASGMEGVAVDHNNYVYLIMTDGQIYHVSLP